MVRRSVLVVALTSMATACHAGPVAMRADNPRSPLKLTRTIDLPNTNGRIDHLAIDLADQRLFVAEIANGTVDIVDLKSGKVVNRIRGLHEPQDVAWLDKPSELVVACGDGTVHFYDQWDQREIASLSLGEDADNVRADSRNGHVLVGYGSGGIATIDPVGHRVIARTVLSGHPEGFRLFGSKAYVNIPDQGSIVTADIDTGRVLSTWSTGAHRLNFPLTIDTSGTWFAVAYRLPASLAIIDVATREARSIRSACGDADDLFIDGRRMLLICGTGHVDAIPREGDQVRIETAPGARTGLFVPELHMLFVAAPARSGAARILELRADKIG